MSILNKVKGLLAKHDDKVGQAVDKAAGMADRRTGGKYSKHIRTGSGKAKEAVEKLSDDKGRAGDGRTGEPGAPGATGSTGTTDRPANPGRPEGEQPGGEGRTAG
ncbi:antitoxin [Streptomyces sparsus]